MAESSRLGVEQAAKGAKKALAVVLSIAMLNFLRVVIGIPFTSGDASITPGGIQGDAGQNDHYVVTR